MATELLLLFVSVSTLITGVVRWQKGSQLRENGKTADAVIIKNPSLGLLEYPTIRFLTDKREWITVPLTKKYSRARHRAPGTKLKVIYNTDDPMDFELASPLYVEVLPRLLTAIGTTGIVLWALELLNYTDLL